MLALLKEEGWLLNGNAYLNPKATLVELNIGIC
jgi:hypothetical protein